MDLEESESKFEKMAKDRKRREREDIEEALCTEKKKRRS